MSEAVGEKAVGMPETEFSMHLKKISHQKHLKVRHDHSSIAGQPRKRLAFGNPEFMCGTHTVKGTCRPLYANVF